METREIQIINRVFFRRRCDRPSIGSSRIPALLFCIYQLVFAAIMYALFLLFKPRALISVFLYSAALAVNTLAERGRLGPVLVFVFIGSTIVYDPITNWTWNSNGWSFIPGGLDFAGGTPVHISSGTTALAISSSSENVVDTELNASLTSPTSQPTSFSVLSSCWFGWFGFNG